MKLRDTAIAVALAFPLLASAQTSDQLQKEIEILKAQVKELQEMIKGKTAVAATPPAEPTVELEEFNRIKTKVEAMEDQQIANGTKGLRISGGIDPVYIWNQAKNTSSFSFGNNFAPIGGSSEMYSYDNSYFGMAYLDFQKEMEGGTKLRLTLAPTKSVASGFNLGSIIQEASASIPLTDAQTRLMVGQMGDVSGYEPTLSTYTGANNITSNQLYPGYGEYFVTKNLLFDFTAANFYTGVGLDLIRGPWEYKFWLANMNANRNDIAVGSTDTGGMKAPAFIYNATYAQDEFWGFEFTGYSAQLPNFTTGQTGRMNQFEIDGNYTRGDFNANLQFTAGQMKNGAFNGQDATWQGVSALVSQKLDAKWTIAGRADYLANSKNGGGIYTLASNMGSLASAPGGLGDVINGFGPGDPNDPSYDPNVGANRYALSLAATYRLTPNVAFRSELRRDFANKSTFYNFGTGAFQNANTTVAFQAIINF